MSIIPREEIHWFYAGFFAAFGAYVAIQGRHFLNARCAWAGLRVAAGDGSSDDNRLEAAVQRRQRAEGPPAPIGLYVGAVCMVLAILSAFNLASFALLYAAFCFSSAVFAAFAFWRLRNSQTTRAAVLTVRKSDSVIPTYWFVASAAAGLLLLSFAGDPKYGLSAILVCVSVLATTYIAWRMTLLPALLSGEDVPAEQVVDDRLRFNRSTTCLVYAFVQTFAMCCQAGFVNDLQAAANVLSLLWIVFPIWITLRRRVAIRLA